MEGTCSKISSASCTSRSSTSAMECPLYFTSRVSRSNRLPSQTGQETHMSARKSISTRVAPLPSQASHRPPRTLKLKRPGL